MEINSWEVVIPNFVNSYNFSEKRKAKFYLWEERDKLPQKYKKELAEKPVIIFSKAYCCDNRLQRFLKNTKTAGTPNTWILNGQDLYNGRIDHRKRSVLARYFHEYFAHFINEQLEIINIPEGKTLSISCDIYEVKRPIMPDVSNLWLLEKFFEDAVVISGKIPDDGPNYVTESGRKRYHWVANPEERKLVFTLKII